MLVVFLLMALWQDLEYQMTPTFGQVIRTAQVNIGYSQRELARQVEIDFTYLLKLESARACYPPKEYVIKQLAHSLGLDKEELMCLTGILPERYQEFLKHKQIPALFRWMQRDPQAVKAIFCSANVLQK